MKTKSTRQQFTRSNKWLRRARAHFCNLARPWCEAARDPIAYRERMSLIGLAMHKHGLLAGIPNEQQGRFSVMTQWRRADGEGWWTWRNKDLRRRVACMWRADYREYVARRRKKTKTA